MSATKRFRALPTAAAATAAALVLVGCSPSGSAADRTGLTAGGGGVATAAPGHREQAPDVSGTLLAGGGVKLSDYRGKVVVLNLWGSWCSACRAEAPGLQELWEKYRDRGVQFLGINTRDSDPANAVAFERNKGVTFPSIYDPDGTQILRFPKGYLDPQSIPTTMVIDRDGRVAARVLGGRSPDVIDAMIRPVLAEPASGGPSPAAAGPS
ncbi:TlpA family protein disulfide reductase [Kitasatospora sp. NA04385]|uniref:TlpA family protein disulfide reductase n=1 Tax=Kitasatospora sp. NA04385 TaxID=2742135 RepID=UPI001591F1E5|nr:TlpA disulfide reductase family protein [Kitasatospora sp. NA04385]QKW19664.1 TlpA family protein disulfide reductase [Kitasatospora sp. NA04385]